MNTTIDQANPVRRARLPVLGAFFMIYIFVSGGSFGIEEMVSSAGPGLTIILLLVLPLIWALPMALVASELGSALPHRGGFYIWVHRGLGEFWGFQTAWWWSLALLVDTSLYLVLGIGFLQNQLGFDDWTRYLLSWGIIALVAWVNIAGIQLVAIGSAVFALLIVSPFIVLALAGLSQWQFDPLTPITPPDTQLLGGEGALVLGLSVGLWMYSGYESMSTLAGEIEEPQRVIPRALMLALPFVALMYLLPTVGSLAAYGQWETFSVTASEGRVSFIDIGAALGGSALGHALLASAVLGNFALYLDYVASGARPFKALADDGLFPAVVARTSQRFGTPAAAILLIALVNAVLIIGPFQSLVIIDVTLFVCAYALIFAAAVALRVKEPELQRPFRIPLGTVGLIALVLPALGLIGLILYVTSQDRSLSFLGMDSLGMLGLDIGWYGIAGIAALTSGPVVYGMLKHWRPTEVG